MSNLKTLEDLQLSSKDGKTIVPVLVELFRNFEESQKLMFQELKAEFHTAMKNKDDVIASLSTEVGRLKVCVSKLEERIETNDQYERRDTLVLSGPAIPPSNSNENSAQLVKNLIRTNLNIQLDESDFSVAHRIGEKPASQRPDRRGLIVKFCRRSTKTDVLLSARKKKPNNFYVNESLTPANQTIAFVLRKMRKDHPQLITGVSTFDGKNFAWIKSSNTDRNSRDTRHAINSRERLVNFCETILNKPLNTYLNEWPH